MVRNLIFATVLLSSVASGAEYKLLEPRDISIEAYKYESMQDPYLYPIDRDIAYGAAFNTDLNVFKYRNFSIYWLNQLHFDQSRTSGHIKHAGWQYEFGVPLWIDKSGPRIELFKQHHSRHILEETRTIHFPVYDRFGVRMRILP